MYKEDVDLSKIRPLSYAGVVGNSDVDVAKRPLFKGVDLVTDESLEKMLEPGYSNRSSLDAFKRAYNYVKQFYEEKFGRIQVSFKVIGKLCDEATAFYDHAILSKDEGKMEDALGALKEAIRIFGFTRKIVSKEDEEMKDGLLSKIMDMGVLRYNIMAKQNPDKAKDYFIKAIKLVEANSKRSRGLDSVRYCRYLGPLFEKLENSEEQSK